VLVESDDHALFGRKPEWPKHRYSTIAGFVEPGESAEQAVVREVAEETNINVLSAHYHSSQPWPFPGSLMLGYHAKATKTQISLNDQELEDAQWLSREEIITRLNQGLFVPPPKISISFRLIEDWFNQSATIPLKKLLHQSGAADF
jgi:NAD+ diphosphatase